jgi:hypothetical protein
MMGPSGLWMGMRWLSKYQAVFLFTMPFSSLLSSISFSPSVINHVLRLLQEYIFFLCVHCFLAKRNKSNKEENDKVKNKNRKEGKAQNASWP